MGQKEPQIDDCFGHIWKTTSHGRVLNLCMYGRVLNLCMHGGGALYTPYEYTVIIVLSYVN